MWDAFMLLVGALAGMMLLLIVQGCIALRSHRHDRWSAMDENEHRSAAWHEEIHWDSGEHEVIDLDNYTSGEHELPRLNASNEIHWNSGEHEVVVV